MLQDTMPVPLWTGMAFCIRTTHSHLINAIPKMSLPKKIQSSKLATTVVVCFGN
jgi:hypothetical protein